MSNTPNGIVYPSLTSAPNVPSDFQIMAASIDPLVIGRFANAAARTAAITAPVDGQASYQFDAKRLERYYAGSGSWSQFLAPRIQVKLTTAGSVPNTAVTPVPWNGVDYNPAGLTQSASGVTAPFAGYADIRFSCEFAANATGRRFATIYKNGAEYTATNRHQVPVNSGTNGTGLVLPGLSVVVAAGDIITVALYQDSSGALGTTAGATMLITFG